MRYFLSIILLIGLLNTAAANEFDNIDEATKAEAARIAQIAADNIAKWEKTIHGLRAIQPDFTARQSSLPDRLRKLIPRNDGIKGSAPPDNPGLDNRLIVFLTLSMPDAAIQGWIRDVNAAGGVAVIRGFHGGKLSTTLARMNQFVTEDSGITSGVQIDPTAFRRLDVGVVPTVVVLKNPLPACQNQGCIGDPIPDADRIAGNSSLAHALGRIAREGDVAPNVARQHLDKLQEVE